MPLASLPVEQRKVALDLVWDRREYDADGNVTYDPLASMLDMFAGVDTAALKDQRAAELAALPTGQRLERRIIDGNHHLLEGMKVVGERFGAGVSQGWGVGSPEPDAVALCDGPRKMGAMVNPLPRPAG